MWYCMKNSCMHKFQHNRAKNKELSTNTDKRDKCGIVFCYNEEHIISDCLTYYLNLGIDLVVIDNVSIDNSLNIIESYAKNQQHYPGKIIDIKKYVSEGYEWVKMLEFAYGYMHANLTHYRWIMLIDADAFYHSPIKNISLTKFLKIMEQYKYNVLEGEVINFYPTHIDDKYIQSPLERMLYCEKKSVIYQKGLFQQKIFKYHPSINFYTSAGHQCIRNNKRTSPIKFLYKHYPWCSYAHGKKKIFKERKPRFLEKKQNVFAHSQYIDILPIKDDLIKSHAHLTLYKDSKFKKSMWEIRSIIFLKNLLQRVTKMLFAFRGKEKHIEWKMSQSAQGYRKNITEYINDYLRFFIHWLPFKCYKKRERKTSNVHVVGENEIKQKRAGVFGLPRDYHFLLTNTCNAKCKFCNQIQEDEKHSVSLEQFKIMFSNIPDIDGRTFYLSGGGEPLLCNDIFKIVEYIKKQRRTNQVRIRTNGLLVHEYIDEIVQSDIDQIEFSIHAASPHLNSQIMETVERDLFYDIHILNTALKKQQKKISKMMCPVVTRQNINEIPKLVDKCIELNFNKMLVCFCKYFEDSHDKEEALVFDKETYNAIIESSKKKAMSNNIEFYHESLFFKRNKKKSCVQPWSNIIIDWNGTVYPCTGGERWFYDAVQKGDYNFGNLMKEHLVMFWNNEAFLKIRKTCSPCYKDTFFEECTDCHNSIYLRGSDARQGHFVYKVLQNRK